MREASVLPNTTTVLGSAHRAVESRKPRSSVPGAAPAIGKAAASTNPPAIAHVTRTERIDIKRSCHCAAGHGLQLGQRLLDELRQLVLAALGDPPLERHLEHGDARLCGELRR